MCPPLLALIPAAAAAASSSAGVAALSLAVTAAGAGLSYAGQQQQAKAQTAMAVQNQQSAEANFRMQQSFQGLKLLQINAQAAKETQDRNIEAAQAQGRVRTSAAESGAAGLNLEALVGDINRQLGIAHDTIDHNRGIQATDSQMQIQNDYAQMVDRRNSVPMGMAPSFLSPVLAIAGAGLSQYSSYQQHQQTIDQLNYGLWGTTSRPSN